MNLELGVSPRLVLFVFLIASMLAIGLRVAWADVREVGARGRGLLARVLIVNFIVIPLAGAAIVRLIPLNPGAREALLMLACAPGGFTAVKYTGKVQDRGALAFAGAAAFMLALLAIFVTPLLLAIALPGEVSIVPSGRAMLYVVGIVLAPIAFGMALRARSEELAERLAKPLALVGALAFIAFAVLMLGMRGEAKRAIGSSATLLMTLFVVGSMAVGWWAGGPSAETRQVTASATSMRNVALCLALAADRFAGRDVQTPLVAFSAIMATPNLVLAIVSSLRARRASKAASPGPRTPAT